MQLWYSLWTTWESGSSNLFPSSVLYFHSTTFRTITIHIWHSSALQSCNVDLKQLKEPNSTIPDTTQQPEPKESFGVTEFFRQWQQEGLICEKGAGEKVKVCGFTCLGKRNFLFSNLKLAELDTMVGSALWSRLYKQCNVRQSAGHSTVWRTGADVSLQA